MIVGTAVPTIIVGTTIIIGTAVPTIIGGTTIPTMTLGTNISLAIVPITLLGAVVPTYVVGTSVHLTSFKISQFKYKTLSVVENFLSFKKFWSNEIINLSSDCRYL